MEHVRVEDEEMDRFMEWDGEIEFSMSEDQKMKLFRVVNYVFGAEEIVDMRRKLVLLREKLLNQKRSLYRHLCSGSLGEGVAFPKSDDDIMTYAVDYRILNSMIDNTRDDLLMVTDLPIVPYRLCQSNNCVRIPYSPVGYCLLVDIHKSLPEEVICNINGVPFVSSDLFKSKLKKPGQTIHGPCLSSVNGGSEIDETRCFICHFWPDIAIEWKVRNRSYGWPSNEIIQSVVLRGCHVVPIGYPGSKHRHLEWRWSFSLAERRLVNSFNHAQFLTYNLLRYALKMKIDKKFPGVLCSYFMKTTLFYTIENTSSQMWSVDNLDICFRECLKQLYSFIDYENCPNYFIPKYNMIKRKVNDTNKNRLLNLIRNLIQKDIIDLLGISRWLVYINETTYSKKLEGRHDSQFFSGLHFLNIMSALRDFFSFDNDGKEVKSSVNDVLHRVYELESIIDTHDEYRFIVILEGIVYCCQALMNRFWNSTQQNKYKYDLHKTIVMLLRLGQMGGLTSGKLTTATYMYMIGKTKLALFVTQQLSQYTRYTQQLSKYTRYDHIITYSLGLEPYCEHLCGKGYSIYFKARRVWAIDYELFSDYLHAFPSLMRMWISIDGSVFLPPLIYALVLESLIHMQLQNDQLMSKAIKRLIQKTDKLKFNLHIASARMCTGIVLYANGNYRSAIKYFRSAIKMRNKLSSPHKETLPSAAKKYIDCLKELQRRNPEENRKTKTGFKQKCLRILFYLFFVFLFYSYLCCIDFKRFRTVNQQNASHHTIEELLKRMLYEMHIFSALVKV